MSISGIFFFVKILTKYSHTFYAVFGFKKIKDDK